MLVVYSALCAAILLRNAVLVFQFPDTVWTSRVILAASAPLVFPIKLISAANRPVIGAATLADFTVLLFLFALPLLLIGRQSRISL